MAEEETVEQMRKRVLALHTAANSPPVLNGGVPVLPPVGSAGDPADPENETVDQMRQRVLVLHQQANAPKIKTSTLDRGDVGGLRPEVKTAYQQAQADLKKLGINLYTSSPRAGKRTIQDQEKLFRELGDYRKGGRAAPPSPTAPHVAGGALDLRADGAAGGVNDPRVQEVLQRYGFRQTLRYPKPGRKAEPWHHEYHPQSGLPAAPSAPAQANAGPLLPNGQAARIGADGELIIPRSQQKYGTGPGPRETRSAMKALMQAAAARGYTVKGTTAGSDVKLQVRNKNGTLISPAAIGALVRQHGFQAPSAAAPHRLTFRGKPEPMYRAGFPPGIQQYLDRQKGPVSLQQGAGLAFGQRPQEPVPVTMGELEQREAAKIQQARVRGGTIPVYSVFDKRVFRAPTQGESLAQHAKGFIAPISLSVMEQAQEKFLAGQENKTVPFSPELSLDPKIQAGQVKHLQSFQGEVDKATSTIAARWKAAMMEKAKTSRKAFTNQDYARLVNQLSPSNLQKIIGRDLTPLEKKSLPAMAAAARITAQHLPALRMAVLADVGIGAVSLGAGGIIAKVFKGPLGRITSPFIRDLVAASIEGGGTLGVQKPLAHKVTDPSVSAGELATDFVTGVGEGLAVGPAFVLGMKAGGKTLKGGAKAVRKVAGREPASAAPKPKLTDFEIVPLKKPPNLGDFVLVPAISKEPHVVVAVRPDGGVELKSQSGKRVTATPEMLAEPAPAVAPPESRGAEKLRETLQEYADSLPGLSDEELHRRIKGLVYQDFPVARAAIDLEIKARRQRAAAGGRDAAAEAARLKQARMTETDIIENQRGPSAPPKPGPAIDPAAVETMDAQAARVNAERAYTERLSVLTDAELRADMKDVPPGIKSIIETELYNREQGLPEVGVGAKKTETTPPTASPDGNDALLDRVDRIINVTPDVYKDIAWLSNKLQVSALEIDAATQRLTALGKIKIHEGGFVGQKAGPKILDAPRKTATASEPPLTSTPAVTKPTPAPTPEPVVAKQTTTPRVTQKEVDQAASRLSAARQRTIPGSNDVRLMQAETDFIEIDLTYKAQQRAAKAKRESKPKAAPKAKVAAPEKDIRPGDIVDLKNSEGGVYTKVTVKSVENGRVKGETRGGMQVDEPIKNAYLWDRPGAGVEAAPVVTIPTASPRTIKLKDASGSVREVGLTAEQTTQWNTAETQHKTRLSKLKSELAATPRGDGAATIERDRISSEIEAQQGEWRAKQAEILGEGPKGKAAKAAEAAPAPKPITEVDVAKARKQFEAAEKKLESAQERLDAAEDSESEPRIEKAQDAFDAAEERHAAAQEALDEIETEWEMQQKDAAHAKPQGIGPDQALEQMLARHPEGLKEEQLYVGPTRIGSNLAEARATVQQQLQSGSIYRGEDGLLRNSPPPSAAKSAIAPKLSPKEIAAAELAAEVEKFAKKHGSKLGANIDPEIVADLVPVIKKLVKLGYVTTEELVQQLAVHIKGQSKALYKAAVRAFHEAEGKVAPPEADDLYVGSLNIDKYQWTPDELAAIRSVYEANVGPITQQRRGTRGWEDTTDNALTLAQDPKFWNKTLNAVPGTAFNAEENQAIWLMQRTSEKHVAEVQARVGTAGLSEADEAELALATAQHDHLFRVAQGAATEAGRALQNFRNLRIALDEYDKTRFLDRVFNPLEDVGTKPFTETKPRTRTAKAKPDAVPGTPPEPKTRTPRAPRQGPLPDIIGRKVRVSKSFGRQNRVIDWEKAEAAIAGARSIIEGQPVATVSTARQEAQDRLSAAVAKFGKKAGSTLSSGVDPTLLVDGLEIARALVDLGYVVVKDLAAQLRTHISGQSDEFYDAVIRNIHDEISAAPEAPRKVVSDIGPIRKEMTDVGIFLREGGINTKAAWKREMQNGFNATFADADLDDIWNGLRKAAAEKLTLGQMAARRVASVLDRELTPAEKDLFIGDVATVEQVMRDLGVPAAIEGKILAPKTEKQLGIEEQAFKDLWSEFQQEARENIKARLGPQYTARAIATAKRHLGDILPPGLESELTMAGNDIKQIGVVLKKHLLETLRAKKLAQEGARLSGTRATPKPQDPFQTLMADIGREADEALKLGVNQKMALRKLRLIMKERGLKVNESDMAAIREAGSDIEELSRVLIDRNKRSLERSIYENLFEVLGINKAIMAAADLGTPLRQAIFFTLSHPGQAARLTARSARAYARESSYEAVRDAIQQKPNYLNGMYDRHKLHIAYTSKEGLRAQEELLANRFIGKIPGIRWVHNASERGMVSYLNMLRTERFDSVADHWIRHGLNPASDEGVRRLDALAHAINIGTGRGNLGKAEGAEEWLRAIFWSPRLQAARINLLGKIAWSLPQEIAHQGVSLAMRTPRYRGKALPAYLARMAEEAPLRQMILKDTVRASAMAASIYAIAKMAGDATGHPVTIVDDVNDTQYGKMKVGNHVYGILGGYEQYARLLPQALYGKTNKKGKRDPADPGNVVGDFMRGKITPAWGTVVDLIVGTDMGNNPVEGPFQTYDKLRQRRWNSVGSAVEGAGDLANNRILQNFQAIVSRDFAQFVREDGPFWAIPNTTFAWLGGEARIQKPRPQKPKKMKVRGLSFR